jgi:hypothetical protein
MFKPNGARECERRRRQIAKGQLTVSNGLFRGEIVNGRLVPRVIEAR